MPWKGQYYRVCLEKDNVIRFVDTGETCQNYNLETIRIVDEYFCQVNALPVVTAEDNLTGKYRYYIGKSLSFPEAVFESLWDWLIRSMSSFHCLRAIPNLVFSSILFSDDQIRLLQKYIGTSIKTVLIGQKDGVGIFEFLIENLKIFESATLPQYSGLHEVKFIQAVGPRPVLCKFSTYVHQ